MARSKCRSEEATKDTKISFTRWIEIEAAGIQNTYVGLTWSFRETRFATLIIPFEPVDNLRAGIAY
jgi:hypothetical protein